MIIFSSVFFLLVAVCGIFAFVANVLPQDVVSSWGKGGNTDGFSIKVLSVGSAGSAIVARAGKYMLIDGGNPYDEDSILRAIKQSGAKKLDYIVCTHPHRDHIGALPAIIGSMEVSRVFCPEASIENEFFKEMLRSTKAKGIEIENPERGMTIGLGGAYVVFLSSGEYFAEENDMSLIFKIYHGDNSFLFMGDAGEAAEKELIADGVSLDCDLLKVGHHGSEYSTCQEFLFASAPKYAIISVGENDTNHPSDNVIERLDSAGIITYCTDERGDIRVNSDGSKLYFEFEK